jgi:phage tail sheath protein FI
MAVMPDHETPHVYVPETGGGRAPITGVATGVAGFVGVAERGPTAPTVVTSWAEFQQHFGGFIDQPPFVTPYWRLPYAVRGFFDNGGKRLYVARVLDAMMPAGSSDLAAVIGDSADPAARTGIAALVGIPDISLMAVPDDLAAPAFADALIDRCDTARNRLAVVDNGSTAADLAAVAQHRDSAFAALYYPRLHVPAPHLAAGYAVVPPCGHVAGVLSATGVGAAAARAAPALHASSLIADGHPSGAGPLDRTVSAGESDWLTPRGVNVIRNFRAAGRGVLVWGARTMSSDPEWKYVNVRRLFTFLEQSIEKGTQWAVFEPNSEPTWTAVRTAIGEFLFARWRDGMLVGQTPREAYFVKCDAATMTQNDIDSGRLVCLVGVAVVRPAEFVIFRIGQWTSDAQP